MYYNKITWFIVQNTQGVINNEQHWGIVSYCQNNRTILNTTDFVQAPSMQMV